MSIINLAPKQKAVWSLKRGGHTNMDISIRLGVSPQFVGQTLNAVGSKISKALVEVARANNVRIQQLYPDKGILVGYHPGLDTLTIVSQTARDGTRIWYWNETPEDCGVCELNPSCKEYLLNEAEETKISLSDEEKKYTPTKLARVVFSRLVPGLKT
jgi:DNA-binding CsgD family transcriptional regulator